MKCDKCGGLMIVERVLEGNGERIDDTHCINCGRRIYNPEIEQIREINRSIFIKTQELKREEKWPRRW